jgi:branched-chain amino acid transport system permease protein
MLRELEGYRMMVFGALLVMMMIIRPEGLWPARRPRLESGVLKKEPPEPAVPEIPALPESPAAESPAEGKGA